MSEKVILANFAIFVIGMFVGGNLGILLLCMLQVAKKADTLSEDLLSVLVESRDL